MPEGDTVFQTARRLRPALAGKVLTRSDIRVPRFAAVDLSGRTVDAVTTRGKHLLIHCGDATVHAHLRMEGVWHVYRIGQRWRRPAHQARIVLRTADAEAVGFTLGMLEILGPAELERRLDHLGPDLLGDDWDPAEAQRRLAAHPDQPIGTALLDQRNLAGVGNVFRSEICFALRIHPATRIADLPDLSAVVAESHRALSTAAERTFGRTEIVYGKYRLPCPRCGTNLQRGVLADGHAEDRSIYFCPRCQPPP